MQYKTITLELLHQRPKLYHTLRTHKTLMETLDSYAGALKERHRHWTQELGRKRPQSEASQLSSEALELALQELQDALPAESQESANTPEPLSLDAAIASLRRRTPPA